MRNRQVSGEKLKLAMQGGDSPTEVGYGRGWRNRTPFIAGARLRLHARTRSHPPCGHTIGRPPAPLPLWFFPYFPTFHKLNTPLKSVFGCGCYPRRHPHQEHQQDRGGAESLAGQVCRDSAVSGGLRFPWLRPTGSLFLSVTFFFLPNKRRNDCRWWRQPQTKPAPLHPRTRHS